MNVVGTIVRIVCLLFKKKPITFDFFYILSSAYIDQSAPNFVQQNLNEFDHGSNWTRVIWSIIEKNCCIRLCVLSNIYKYKPFSTKLGHNEYEHKISDELITGQVIPDQLVFSVLEIEKLNFSSLFGISSMIMPVLAQFMRMLASVCVCVRLLANARVCVRLLASVCVCLRMLASVCVCVRLLANARVCSRLCASVCVCLRMLASVCVCVRLLTSKVPNARVCVRLCASV